MSTATEQRRLGRYRLERQLGGGDFSDVFAAVDERLGRNVAVKVLKGATTTDHVLRERFLQEANAVARFHHPGIAPVYDAGLIDGELVLVMPLIAGEELADRLAIGPLPVSDTLAVVGQLAAAIGAAGDAGLVHCDVKPTNVLLSPAVGRPFHVTLVDFGISAQTGAGTTSGLSVDYAAPEQLQGGPLDARTDTYGLACLTFECLTGRPPFSPPGSSPDQVRKAHLREQPPRPSRQNADLGTRFDAVLAKGLAKAPADRFQTCDEFAAALTAASRGPEQPVAPSATGSRRLAVAAAALGVLGLAALGFAVLGGDDDNPAATTVAPLPTVVPGMTAATVSVPTASSGVPPAGQNVTGYWLLTANGNIVDQSRQAPIAGLDQVSTASPVVGMIATPTQQGLWVAHADGTVDSVGDADAVGTAAEVAATIGVPVPSTPIVAIIGRTPGGFWLLDQAGALYPYLGASAPATAYLVAGDQPVAAAGNPQGEGLWVVGRRQAIYTIGRDVISDLTNTCPGLPDVVAAVATPAGTGMWLVDAAGQVTSCGSAPRVDPLDADIGAQGGVVGAVAAPDGGLWVVDRIGRTFPLGGAADLPDATVPGDDPVVAVVLATE